MRGTGIGTSLMLIAAGAVLAFAVDYRATGVDIAAIGWILLVVGLIGLMVSFVMLGDTGWFGGGSRYVERDRTYVSEKPHTHIDSSPLREDEVVERVEREEHVRPRRVYRS